MALALTLKANDVAHEEQLVIWADDICFALLPWLKDPESYDDKIALAEAIKRECYTIVEITLDRARHAISEHQQ